MANSGDPRFWGDPAAVPSGGGGTASATSTEVSAVSAQALSALNVVSNRLSAVSAINKNTGLSVEGLQGVINALSDSISAVNDGVAGAEAHADLASAAATSVNSRVTSVNSFLSGGISVRVVAGTSIRGGLQSIVNALSDKISSTSAVLSDRITSVANRVNSVNSFISGISSRSVGDISTHGLQSVINALSNRISAAGGGGSVTSAEVQVASAAATSVDGRATSLANAISVNLSAVLNASTGPSIAAISLMSDTKSAVANVSCVSGAGSATGLQDVIQALSVRVDAVSNADSVTRSALAAASTVGSIAALSLAIANDASVSAAVIANISAQIGSGQFKMVTGAQAIATATFTKVSGLSLSIGGSGFYEVHGQLVWSQSGAGSASAIFNFGMSCTQTPVMAMFAMCGNTGALGAAGALSAFTQFGGNSAMCATPSIMYSAKPNPGVSGSVACTMFFDGVMQCSTAAGILEVVAACSTAAFGINIQPGSFIRAFKIG